MAGTTSTALLVAVILVSCKNATADAQNDLNTVVSDFWSWRLGEEPEFATRIGANSHNDRLRSYDYARFETRKDKAQEMLDKLQEVDTARLDGSGKLTFDVLKDNLQVSIDGFRWRNYGTLNPLNFLEGVHAEFKYTASLTPFNTKADYDRYLKRLRQLPNQLNEIMALMTKAIELKTTNHNVSMLAVPSQIASLYNRSVENLDIYEPFKEALTNLTDITTAQKVAIRNDGRNALSDMVAPAFMNLSRFIEDVYIPNCRSTYGVGGMPDGENYYKACLKWHLSLDMTPKEVHAQGLGEVKRLKAEMLSIARKTDFTGTNLVQYFKALNNDERFFRNTSKELLDLYNDIIFMRIKPQLKKLFNDVTQFPFEVRPMEFDGPAGVYYPPAEDGSKPGIFWVNLRQPEKRATFDMAALSLHEADPGHHMQFSYMLREKNPAFRKHLDDSKYFSCPTHFPFYTAYLEGWALYAEDLGIEMGSFKDDYELFGKYSSEMFRACRLVVDTGLHAMGWSRDQAIDYMAEHIFDLRSQLEIEVDRYITWPGQACAYKVGQMWIQKTRKMAETKLGENFNLAEFHDVVLRMGAGPMKVLRKRVEDWVTAKVASGVTANSPMLLSVFMSLAVNFCLYR